MREETAHAKKFVQKRRALKKDEQSKWCKDEIDASIGMATAKRSVIRPGAGMRCGEDGADRSALSCTFQVIGSFEANVENKKEIS